MAEILGLIGKNQIELELFKGMDRMKVQNPDSTGLVYYNDGEFKVLKTRGNFHGLIPQVGHDSFNFGLAHLKKPSTGVKTAVCSHPFISQNSAFALTQIGRVDNYVTLRKDLIAKGYKFETDCDTEVVANLFESLLDAVHDPLEVLRLAAGQMKGKYAIVFVHLTENGRFYYLKNGAPLYLGFTGTTQIITSCTHCFETLSECYLPLEDGDYGYLSLEDHRILNAGQKVDIYPQNLGKKPQDIFNNTDFDSFLLKEIHEIPAALNDLVAHYFKANRLQFLPAILSAIKKAPRVVFIACGSSYYASLFGIHYFKEIGINAEVKVASEWLEEPKAYEKEGVPLFILVSQSGETNDVLQCLEIIREHNWLSIGITNHIESIVGQRTTFALDLYAGVEFAVPATKTYFNEVVLFYLLKAALSSKITLLNDIFALIESLHRTINVKAVLDSRVEHFKDVHNILFSGYGLDYFASRECALKMKEIALIHAESLPGGELKHGAISLLEDKFPTISLLSQKNFVERTRQNVTDITAAGGLCLVISSATFAKETDFFVCDDVASDLAPLVKIVAVDLLAYYIAKKRGINVDRPRNLSKVV